MRDEHPPIEHGDRVSPEEPDSKAEQSDAQASGRLRPTAEAPAEAAGCRALRALTGSLSGAHNLGLLRHEPGNGAESAGHCQPVAALRCVRGSWMSWPLQDLWSAQFLSMLCGTASADVEVATGAAAACAPVSHLLGSLVIWCRDQQGRVGGAVIASPDPYPPAAEGTPGAAAAEPPAPLVDLLTSLALMALEVEQSRDELTQMSQIVAEEVKARESFISFAAHELRSPLTSIKGFAQLLVRQSRKMPLPDSMMRSVRSIEQQSSRMSEMLGEMLDASRIQRGTLEVNSVPMDLAPLVTQVVRHRQLLFPDHDFELYGAATAIPGNWDIGRVEQILRDLLDNAARHSSTGSTIDVTLVREPRRVMVSVRDEGTGIAEADQPYLFEHLYRTPDSMRRNLSGLGLGLFVSRYLAHRMGGELWLESSRTELPSGSEFRFILPIHSTDAAWASEAGDTVH